MKNPNAMKVYEEMSNLIHTATKDAEKNPESAKKKAYEAAWKSAELIRAIGHDAEATSGIWAEFILNESGIRWWQPQDYVEKTKKILNNIISNLPPGYNFPEIC